MFITSLIVFSILVAQLDASKSIPINSYVKDL